MNEKTARVLLGVALPAAIVAIGYVPFLMFRSQLPDRVATHYTSSGVPDGSQTPTALAGGIAIPVLIGIALCGVVAFRRKPFSHLLASSLPATGAFFAGLFASILAGVSITQRSIDDWTEAGGPGVITVVAVLVGLGAMALAAWLAMFLPSLRPEVPQGASPTMAFAPGERAVWSGATTSRALLGIGCASAALLGLGFIATSGVLMTLIGMSGVVAVLATAHVRVRCDQSGLHVKYGVLPWPRTHLSVDEIESVSVIDVRPKEWGGWGYRGSLRFMNQAAVVHRAGPGMRLDLRNGKVFVVTVDAPETGVALLNGEIARLAVV